MKKVLLLLITIIFLSNTKDFGQNNNLLGNHWYYSFYSSDMFYGYIRMDYTKDTLIYNKNYVVIEKTLFALVDYFTYISYDTIKYSNEYLRWDVDSVFRFINGEDALLYCFSAQIGDTMMVKVSHSYYPCDSMGKIIVNNKGTIYINGLPKRWISVSALPGSIIELQGNIIEGIGSVGGYFFPEYIGCIADVNEGGPFRCFSINDSLIYGGSTIYPCDYISNVNHYSLNSFKIVPNPILLYAQISLNQTYHNIVLAVYDIQGKLMLQNHYADCDKIQLSRNGLGNGMYFLKLALDDKEVETGKIVITNE
jgi:hypothetical protein